MDEFFEKIESLLGHRLSDRKHLKEALTHRSFVNEASDKSLKDNERYEFLGDAVLQLIVSDFLMRNYPDDSEGTLSKYRSAVVNEKSLAQIARNMNLGKYIRLGKGEELTQGRKKDSILADAFEAMVAAVYISEGMKDAAAFVEHYLKHFLKTVEDRSEQQDYKTTLQEYTQKMLKTTPQYILITEEGPDHDKMFESEVIIDNQVYGRGKAKSKKDSEQICAYEALKKLQDEMKNGVRSEG